MLASLFALALSPVVLGATYPLAESWSGSNFLNGWKPDPSTYDNTTNGDVFWGRPATNTSLYYTTSSGTTILKVDNTSSVVYNEKRYAPKLLSKTAYPVGTVWVMDAVHMPYGCSVWPSFWTQGANWPAGGEIDIVEGVNLQQGNQVAMHAAGTCTATPMGTTTGTQGSTNCTGGFGNSGCTYKDNNANSYGAGFASGGGGVYVAELATEGIRVWFLTRSAVPSAITASATSIDTSTLGTPVASYSSSSCNIASLFTPQTMTLTITLCGDFAGGVLQETCPALVGTNTCYTTYVVNEPGQKYDNAYFEINYVNVYSSSKAGSTTGSSASASASGSGTQTVGTRASNVSASGAAATSSRAAGSRRWESSSLGMGWMMGVAAGLLGGAAFVL